MAKTRRIETRTTVTTPIAQNLIEAADNLVTPTAKLLGDTLSQSVRVVEVATANFAKLIGPEGGSSVTKLVGDTVEESLKVAEVATKRTWELVDTFFGEAGRVAKSVRNQFATSAA